MEENNYSSRIIKENFKTKKLKPKIDLAAMVSISFLLIIFFMVTTELARPQAMDLGLPDDSGCGFGGCGYFRCERVITLLLVDDNKIISYRGLLEFPENGPSKLDYGKEIRVSLMEMSKQILERTGTVDKGAIVIIKPSKKCNYGNLVDILDEMSIAHIPTYAIINDFTPEEMKLLASN